MKADTGQVFGRLTYLGTPSHASLTKRNKHGSYRCECGRIKDIDMHHVSVGNIRSCGCLLAESVKTMHLRHGMARARCQTPEYRTWCGIKKRCFNENSKDYRNYGGRGIAVCEAWKNDFAAFLEHVGRRPSASFSLDRINNDGHYEIGNVRWALKKVQCRNMRKVRKLTIDGRTMSVPEWAEFVGVQADAINTRLRRGVHPFIAVFRPMIAGGYHQKKPELL